MIKQVIKEILEDKDIKKSTKIIRKSFKTVAKQYSLTKKNCPTHPSFITYKNLKDYQKKDIKFFGLFDSYKQLGFVAIEKADGSLFYLEKLSVLPKYRHNGYGTLLMNHVFNYVKINGGKKVSIAIINDSTILKRWYQNYGFIEKSIKKIDKLPFMVCFLEKKV